MKHSHIYLESKPRYEILDGLRGVAALVVVVFHCFETYIPAFGTQHVNHGYMAVDFFFMLSGFVIGYAYDDRWGQMTTADFFKRRLIRLHPMVIAGTLIGAALFFFGSCDGFPLIAKCEPYKFLVCLLLALFMIPAGPNLDIRGWGETNSFNGPNWSLTLEYIGNILYALVLRRLPNIALLVCTIASLFFTLDMTLGWDTFELFDQQKYNLIGGWSLTPSQMYIGIGRLLFPFLCGLLISRLLRKRSNAANPSGSPISVRGGFWIASALLVAVMAFPQIMGKECLADGLYQALVLALVFPTVVLIGAGSTTTDAKSTKLCKTLGELSYPLYITHYPIMYMQMAWVEKNMAAPAWQHIVLNIGVVALSITLAWGCYKLYDLPVREWLKQKLFAIKPNVQSH